MVDVNLDPSQDTVSLAAVTWMMNLFGPEMMYTPWNYHADFLTSVTMEENVTFFI